SYHRLTVEGYLENGIPPQYGFGAADVVKARVEGQRLRALADAQESAGRGDIDRLMTEWRSLLRQIVAASPISEHAIRRGVRPQSAAGEGAVHFIAERWDNLRSLAHAHLSDLRLSNLPELPALTAEQRRPVNHRFYSRGTGQGAEGRALRGGIPARG
ncbi:MAG: hypothetical protein KAX37_02090, partial [Opitutaceae bacterium]|nr:hypothetical protein [Opitutaceae bacterium]